jgi:anti-anti-sigma regulatory factor
MALATRPAPDATVIELAPHPCSDPNTTEALREDLLASGQTASLVLDCRRVNVFGAALLGVLLSVTRRLPAAHELVLCGLDSLALEVLRITRLDAMWRTYPTPLDALQALRADPVPAVVEVGCHASRRVG